MAYRNGNYVAFYVAEPFSASALGANATKDFCYYNLLRTWKGADSSFPFNDSHDKTYNVRDNSDWETTLKPRLRERLRSSKNVVLILSSVTVSSRALREELEYGINDQELPVIVIYPGFDTKESLLSNGSLSQGVKSLWDRIPIFRDSMDKVPTLHVPLTKSLVESALKDEDFMLATKTNPGNIDTPRKGSLNRGVVYAMKKVNLFDGRVVGYFLKITSAISAILSLTVLFVDIPTQQKLTYGWIFLGVLVVTYIGIWIWAGTLNHIDIRVEGSDVSIKVGDIFEQSGLKVIAFNEYFDTQVDNRIVAEESLNGLFIKEHLTVPVPELDRHIDGYTFERGDILDVNSARALGKKTRYQIGTICVYKDYLLTAFSKFDSSNRAQLTMPEYLEFLIMFWDRVNNVYAQQNVSTPIFGSGITRIKGHRNISDEDLLKIMLWTFRISEMRFKYPARLTVVIHKEKIGRISLLDIKSARNGI